MHRFPLFSLAILALLMMSVSSHPSAAGGTNSVSDVSTSIRSSMDAKPSPDAIPDADPEAQDPTPTATNAPPDLPEGKPVALSVDDSVGAISDAEGSVLVLAANDSRWRPAREGQRLAINTMVKTGSRGAHAATVSIHRDRKVILGPGAQVLLRGDGVVRLMDGEAEVTGTAANAVTVEGPGESTHTVRATPKVYRTEALRMSELAAAPKWLTGYKDSSVSESLGSLLATVDGRAVALSLGYHRVTVDIRDQIARTVIEESFINHTKEVLEGEFIFPLPADASISGFAMWIGGELVEADIVEKERARAIYEQLLKEKKDPGLLEWTSANLFKARVYPIHHEKRIRIVYTQVLPKTGDAFSYHYALRSELLRARPLDELSMDIRLWSDRPLASVTASSHACRIANTNHAARIQFSATGFTPDRDFEATFTTAKNDRPISLVTNRRGDDGYFMLQLDSPSSGAASTIDNSASSKREVLIVADTSGSMSGNARVIQRAALDALLDSLGERDTFNLVLADLDVTTAFATFETVSNESRARARQALDERGAMGWTDLARCFRDVLPRIGRETIVVYLGDGMPTAGDADPVKVVAAMREAHKQGSVHAIGCGNAYDATVLNAMASLGAGSWRVVSDASDALSAINGLLSDVERPGMRGVKVEISGIETAAVYPRVLPNLPAGRQHILTGRMNPLISAAPIVRVTGEDAGKPFDFTVDLPGSSGTDNSFVPRFWARHHMDALMSEGRNPRTKAKVVALSEDFQIISPHTSLLVLEDDALRERFKVEKRLKMRDGEEFFAQGRENASYELQRQQMLAARAWRVGLRAEVIEWLKTMGKGLNNELQPLHDVTPYLTRGYGEQMGGAPHSAFGMDGAVYGEPMPVANSGSMRRLGGVGGGTGGSGSFGGKPGSKSEAAKSAMPMEGGMPAPEAPAASPLPRGDWGSDKKSEDASGGEESEESRFNEDSEEFLGEDANDDPSMGPADELNDEDGYVAEKMRMKDASPAYVRKSYAQDSDYYDDGQSEFNAFNRYNASFGVRNHILLGGRWPWEPRPQHVIDGIFPSIPDPTSPREAVRWPSDVAELANSLSRMPTPESLASRGLTVAITTTDTDPRDRDGGSTTATWYLANGSWATEYTNHRGEVRWRTWTNGGRRGAWSGEWDLARTRAAKDGDARDWPALPGELFGEIAGGTWGFSTTLTQADSKRVLTLRTPFDPKWRREVDIHPTRPEILELRDYEGAKRTRLAAYGAYRDIGGTAYPSEISYTHGEQDRPSSKVALAVTSLTHADAASKVTTAATMAPTTLVLGELPKNLAESRTALKDGRATPEQAWQVLLHYASSQQWTKANAAEQFVITWAAGKPGENRIRVTLLQLQRRNEQALKLMLAMARKLVEAPGAHELERAERITSLGNGILGNAERLQLHLALAPVYQRHYAEPGVERNTMNTLRWLLSGAGQHDASRDVFRGMRTKWPEDLGLRIEHASMDASDGELDKAVAMVRAMRAEGDKYTADDQLRLLNMELGWLFEWGRWVEYALVLETESRAPKSRVEAHHLNRALTLLVMQDRGAEADSLIEAWLNTATLTDPNDIARARRMAAIQQAIGDGWNLGRVDANQRWHGALLALVRATAADDANTDTLHSIMGNWYFRNSSEGKQASEHLWQLVTAGVMDMPVARLSRLITLLRNYGFSPDESDKPWVELANRIIARWEANTDEGETESLMQAALSICDDTQRLRIRRAAHARETLPHRRMQSALHLMGELRRAEWNDAFPAEYVSLIVGYGNDAAKVGMPKNLLDRAAESQVFFLHNFVTWVTPARARALEIANPDSGKLARRQLLALRRDLLAKARLATHDDLKALRARYDGHVLAPWIDLERIELGYRLKQEPQLLFNEVAALAKPLAARAAEGTEGDWQPRERVLLGRTLTMLSWMAFDTPKQTELALALRPILDQAATHVRGSIGRLSLTNWLVAADSGDDLRQVLATWFGSGTDYQTTPWGRMLARIQAEQNLLMAAIATMRGVANVDDLSSGEWDMLANWLMAADDKPGHLSARLESHQVRDEWTLQNSIQNESYSFGSGSSMEVTEDLITRIRIMVTKSSNPGNRLWAINRIYNSTKDFRILQALANAVPGQTPARIYNLIQGLMPIVNGIGEEATFDRLAAELETIRASTTSPTDIRGLNLLECLTARAAAQLQGGAEHAERAHRALNAAYKLEWLPGERLLYAALLQNMGKSANGILVNEQIKQLENLYLGAERGSHEALAIASNLADLHAASSPRESGDHAKAIMTLAPAISAFRMGRGDLMQTEAEWALDRLVQYYVAAGEYSQAERVWREELVRSYPARRRWSLEDKLAGVWVQALANNATLSIGSGQELFKAATSKLLADMFVPAEDRVLQRRMHRFVELHNVAGRREGGGTPARPLAIPSIREFAYTHLPKFLDQTHGRLTDQAVNSVGHAINTLLGPGEAVAFLVLRAENERPWLARYGRDFWSRGMNYQLAEWRLQAGNSLPAGVADRLLTLVLAELRRDLTTGYSRSRYLYGRGRLQWTDKIPAFRRTALEMATSVASDEARILHIANYLHYDLNQPNDAINLLRNLMTAGQLSYDGRSVLASYYEQANRHGDALLILMDLLATRPSDYGVRTRMIAALVATDQAAKALEMTKAAAEWLKANQGWESWNIVSLAQGISGAKATIPMLQTAEAYYLEAITMYLAGRSNKWAPDWSLGEWHGALATIRSRLGKVIEAIDSASAAIVLWGPWQDQRNSALQTLDKVMKDAKDMAAVVAHIDAEVAKSGLENPILRKSAGRALADRREYSAAIGQFELALAVAPEDVEIHTLVVNACERAKDWEQMAAKLKRQIGEHPFDMTSYNRLSQLLEDRLNNPSEALRVATTMVEVSPNETKGQAAMAVWFMDRKRWAEALDRWEQVIRVKPNDPEGYIGKIRVLIRSGKRSDASDLARDLLKREWPDTVTDLEEQLKRVLSEELDGRPASKSPAKSDSKPAPGSKPSVPPQPRGDVDEPASTPPSPPMPRG